MSNKAIGTTGLNSGENWSFWGNILIATGTLCVTIGSIIRLAYANELPQQPLFFGGTNHGGTNQPNRNIARDYFSP